jgi:O-antigen biosynthesis protein WbqP
MKRLFDLFMGVILLIILVLPMLIITILVRLTSAGPALYWSDRIGRDNASFRMPKFRSIRMDTPVVATHLMSDAETFLTPIGGFLRRYSLDELPQLYSVLKGDMSFVGPRPALFNQDDLISLRTEPRVDRILPGITGWAQVNGRDDLSIPEKIELEVEYMHKKSFWFDLKILWLTFLKVINRKGVSH